MLRKSERTTRSGLRLEDFSLLAHVDPEDFMPPWDLNPRPPFRTQAWHESDPVRNVSGVTRDFDRAMDAAVQTLGPAVGAAMVVLDEGFNVCFGYVSFSSTLVEFGAPVWYGCRAGYEWLERSGRVDLMSLAVWESTAKDRAR